MDQDLVVSGEVLVAMVVGALKAHAVFYAVRGQALSEIVHTNLLNGDHIQPSCSAEKVYAVLHRSGTRALDGGRPDRREQDHSRPSGAKLAEWEGAGEGEGAGAVLQGEVCGRVYAPRRAVRAYPAARAGIRWTRAVDVQCISFLSTMATSIELPS